MIYQIVVPIYTYYYIRLNIFVMAYLDGRDSVENETKSSFVSSNPLK